MASEDKQDCSTKCAESCRVGIRVPPFYPEKPALWFAQLEAQFALSNITSDTTKYYHTISQLDPQYAVEVEDVISTPPAAGKYDKLKVELIRRLSDSRDKKIKQLLSHEELGDRKPSQFARHLQNLAGPGVPDDFLRSIWTSRLPQTTQSIIASQPKASLEELADLADRIHDVVTPNMQVASTSSQVPAGNNDVAVMDKKIAMLTDEVRMLAAEVRRSRPTQRARSQTRRPRSSTRSQSNYRRYPQCWYHQKFGDKARRCIKPCDFAGKVPGDR
ncbi:hypothetical protein O3G_MSEX012022 [Manduca sexta]|uniref:DUF7041 domain-containing protein n=1 Tax=Manduca sexta TaxID=7130 RepID=A0A921ZMD4_MANSE|nr:hypothetical protein O3G_MSEX012022 [Manduca sexta]